MKFSSIPVVFLLAFFFTLLVVTQGNEESNEMVAAGSANLTDAGKADNDCEKRSSDKCSREGGQSGGADSEESVFENEDYIYTQSLNP